MGVRWVFKRLGPPTLLTLLLISQAFGQSTPSATGGGSITESQDLDDVVTAGRDVTTADAEADWVFIGKDARLNGVVLGWDATSGAVVACYVAGVLNDCDRVIQIDDGNSLIIKRDDGTELEKLTEAGVHTYTGVGKPRKSVWFGAGSLSTDGTQCAAPAEVTPVTSGPKLSSIICTDNAASTIYGSIKMPDAWDGGTVTFTHVYQQTAADTGILNGDIACQAHSNGEAPTSTYGSTVAIDDAAVTGSGKNDMTTSAAVTCAGTTLAGGDMLYFKYLLSTDTTTAVTTLHHLGFMMEYTVASRSD